MDDPTLLAWMVEALEPDRNRDVARAVAARPELQLRVAELRAQLDADARAVAVVPAVWRIPPPGLSGGQRPFLALPFASDLDGGPPQPSGGFAIRIEPVDDPADRWVVVMLRGDDGWAVLFPGSAEERIRLDELPPHPDGGWTLDLIGADRAGEQRWAVALPPWGFDADWSVEDPTVRWRVVQAAVARGEVPVTAVAVVFGGPA